MPELKRTPPSSYRGRLAPSPTGLLHVGHARTFWTAYQRSVQFAGSLILRVEDLDAARCKPEFERAILEDLAWLGVEWQEGPDKGGSCAPYHQSQRLESYRTALEKLMRLGAVYPCICSRKDIRSALTAPHAADDEPIYPGTCRPGRNSASGVSSSRLADRCRTNGPSFPRQNWRFQVPDGERVTFADSGAGDQEFVAGRDFGDFLIWRQDGWPSYQLACVVDDAAMGIVEVVRGQDLLVSTARQVLLYRALELIEPRFHHCPLVKDAAGRRLAKRHDALSLRLLRMQGVDPASMRQPTVGT